MYNKVKELLANDLILFEKELSCLLHSDIKLLDMVVEHINNNTGKRLRPIVMLLLGKLFTENNNIKNDSNDIKKNQLIDYAVTVETLHQATLVHDDVVDDSKERRGKPSVNLVWGNKVSVLLGDYMFAKCFRTLYKYRDYNVMNIISETIRVMSEGELLALELSNTLSQTEESYYKIIYSKTASLIEASCKVASLVYTEQTELIDAVAAYGRNIGMGFQMLDDLFDYTKDNKLIGKPVGNDIKERQITLPLIYALNNSSATERERILSILKFAIISEAQIKDIIDFTKVMGGMDYTINKANEFIDQAISCLDIFPNGHIKDNLVGFAKYMVERKK